MGDDKNIFFHFILIYIFSVFYSNRLEIREK